MSLSLVLKAMARLPGFSSKLHKPVVRASLRVAEDPSDGGLSERAPWPFPSASPSASVGAVFRSSVVVVGGLYGLGSRTFRTFLGRLPSPCLPGHTS